MEALLKSRGTSAGTHHFQCQNWSLQFLLEFLPFLYNIYQYIEFEYTNFHLQILKIDDWMFRGP